MSAPDGPLDDGSGPAAGGGPGYASLTDEALMLTVQAGAITGLQELMVRYERGLYAFLVRYTGDEHLAEDLFQDVFLRLVAKRDVFDPSRGFRAWLFSIAANLARDACRRRTVRGREVRRERIAGRNEPARPDEEAERLEEIQMVREALDGLPDDARAMVLLHFHQGLPYREVAAALEVPVGTVKSRVHWAVARLARELGMSTATRPVGGPASAGNES